LELVRLFVDFDVDAALEKRQRRGQPADAGADDNDFSRDSPMSRHAARPLCSAAASAGAPDSAASVSATSRRMRSPTERICLMPPAVWPAVSRHAWGRPDWVVETI